MDSIDEYLYPRSGEYYSPGQEEDKKRSAAAEKERQQVLRELKNINAVIERLKDRVAFYRSNSSIPTEILTDPSRGIHVMLAHKIVADALECELLELTNLVAGLPKE